MQQRVVAGAWPWFVLTLVLAGSSGRAQAQLVTGFETPFTTGTINGQQGWATSTDIGAAAALTVSTANPLTGSRHFRIAANTAVSDDTITGAFSPATGFTGTTRTTSSVDLNISAAGGANYGVILQAPSQGFITARVEFDYQGNIFVVDDLGGGATFVDTGVAWNEAVYRRLTVKVDSIADSITYEYGGVPIYTGVAGVFAGTTVEQVFLYSDNYHNPGEFGDYDNLSVTATPVPEPAGLSLAALGVVGLVARFRRKKAA